MQTQYRIELRAKIHQRNLDLNSLQFRISCNSYLNSMLLPIRKGPINFITPIIYKEEHFPNVCKIQQI